MSNEGQETEMDLQALFEAEVVKAAPRNQPFIGVRPRPWLKDGADMQPLLRRRTAHRPRTTPDISRSLSLEPSLARTCSDRLLESRKGSFGGASSAPKQWSRALTLTQLATTTNKRESASPLAAASSHPSTAAGPGSSGGFSSIAPILDANLQENLLFHQARTTPDSVLLKACPINWDTNLKHAHNALLKGLHQDALQRLDRVLLAAPDNVSALFVRGVVLIHLRQTSRAVQDFSGCLKAAPSSPLSWFNRGVARACGNMMEEALADLSQAIHLRPDDVQFRHNRGLVHRLQGDFLLAQKDYMDARRIKETQKTHSHNLKQAQKACAAVSVVKRMSMGLVDVGSNSGNGAPSPRLADVGEGSPLEDDKLDKEEELDFPDDGVPSFNRGMFDIVGRALDKRPRARSDVELDLLAQSSRHLKCMHPLTEEELRRAWRFLKFRRCVGGQRVFEQGDPANFLVIIWSGFCAVRVPKDSKRPEDLIVKIDGTNLVNEEDEVTVNIAEPGDILGDINLEDANATRAAACVAVGAAELLVLNRHGYRHSFSNVMRRLHKEKMECLAGLPFSKGWSEQQLYDFAKIAYDYHFRAGEVIVKQGEKVDALFVLKSGTAVVVRAVKDMAGVDHPAIIARLAKGDVFGELCLLDPLRNHPATVTCEYPTTMLRIEKQRIESEQLDNLFRREEDKAKLRAMSIPIAQDARLLQRCLDHEQWLRDKGMVMSQKGNDKLLGRSRRQPK